MMTRSDVTIERNREGGWACHALVHGYLVQRQYYFFTKREALATFLADLTAEAR